jgi:hypothetical protein
MTTRSPAQLPLKTHGATCDARPSYWISPFLSA